jgi:putative RNA 2'-phosphotransferase
MITEKENTRISKFLSWVLRHKPHEIGLTLDENGWAGVNDLIEKSKDANVHLTIDILKHIVDTNSKKRFSFNEPKDKIRANQGHSIEVDLALTRQEPPEFLFHGTAERFAGSILENGIVKQERHHVHLSSDVKTAINVGQRHGKPVVFEIASGQMHKNGFEFFISDNGVWLTANVPSKYLTLLTNERE